ncbi:MAG: LptF/LptG family permease [Bacteroidales bacterium]|jgi:lipopolysaccharide export system permease protein|nr:LptF/LptG family permease [Bacteroidales bacterium]MEA4966914.1 LptF/LptG family permease [Bacteroidaceae bacterium]MDD2575999.1 LptF/LptG family permease [Bacteroidales bacterium]MDD4738346.1 LptF/LptG family permease [Bacteroidales bacterium]MDY4789831.1 LptF/LptG family permease [Bacteroidales bacterium]
MLKKIDWYIIKQLLATFFLAIALIILIVIVFDISEKLDDFLEREAPMKAIIFTYYVNFIPYFVNLFGHLFFFIAVIYLSSRMASRTEIIAILSSGVSFKRFLRPFLLSSILIAVINIYLTNILIPQVNKPRIEFEKVYWRNPYKNQLMNIHIQTDRNNLVYVQSFNNINSTGYRFTKETFNDKNVLIKKISANNIIYDSIKKDWTLVNYSIREINGLKENLVVGDSVKMDLKMKPSEFNINNAKVETMTFSELNTFIKKESLRGSKDINNYLIEKYQRLINPLAYIILTLIGVSLSSRKTRGGTGMHLAAGITLAFAFIMMMKVTSVFSIKGNLPPIVSVFIPIIFFTFIGLYLLKKAPK